MNKERKSSLGAIDFYERSKDLLKLKQVSRKIFLSRKIDLINLQKNSLSVQIWGRKDIQEFSRFSSQQRIELVRKRLQKNPACVILADGLTFPAEVKEEARQKRVTLFYSSLSQRVCQERLKTLFKSLSRHRITLSGGLIQISGLGILIVGDSGIGKSESILELISRGHRFVCDDVVDIEKKSRNRLIGSAPSLTRNFMEIRGLGIINIKEIFGSEVVCRKTEIDLVVELKKWQKGKEYDRIGLKFPEDYEILGVKIPLISIPVATGRNISTLIEVACKVLILRRRGYHAPKEVIRKLNRALTVQ